MTLGRTPVELAKRAKYQPPAMRVCDDYNDGARTWSKKVLNVRGRTSRRQTTRSDTTDETRKARVICNRVEGATRCSE